jgi:hypothetical protein
MTNDELRELAARLATRCRWIIQACLRVEEWQDAADEFFDVILEGLQHVNGNNHEDD